jgi:carotenoid cleavage dioxygenase-like enzyme
MGRLKTLQYWEQGNLAPVREEVTVFDLPVRGDLPRELSGTLYRNEPNPQFRPRGHHHWFAGDGMVHAFRIDGGRVSYRNRWMRTPKFEFEHAQARALFAAFSNPAETDPSAIGNDSGVANTNVVSHASKLLALEESHLPFAFDPVTLESLGYHDCGGLCHGRSRAGSRRIPRSIPSWATWSDTPTREAACLALA